MQKSINLAASLGPLFNDNTAEIIKKWPREGEQPQRQPEFFNNTIFSGGAARWKQEGCHTGAAHDAPGAKWALQARVKSFAA